MASADGSGPEGTYRCTERDCTFHWQWKTGYFCVESGEIAYPANIHELLKPALIREHGYMYIGSVDESKKRTWRCAAKDCTSSIAE